jgi:hypothetical protein
MTFVTSAAYGRDLTTLNPDTDVAGLPGSPLWRAAFSMGFIRQYAVRRAENDFGNPSLTTKGQNSPVRKLSKSCNPTLPVSRLR